MNETHSPVEIDDTDLPEPKNLRNLRILVTVFTVSMILGILTILALVVIKIAQPAPAPLPRPPQVTLPYGETAQAVTQGRDWFAIVTYDRDNVERIRIFNADGSPRQTVDIKK